MVLAKKDKISVWPLWIMTLLMLTTMSCHEEDRLGVVNAIDTRKAPQLSTRNVSTLISDSGYTKYKVITPLWNIYNGEPKEERESYWDFPEGVYLRQLDKNLKVVSTVAADSACYFPNKKLWELYGRVEIDQKEKAYFYSERIFFDDKTKKISSDTFIHIKTPTEILEGVGFESNMSLTQYRVLRPTGMFPMNPEGLESQRREEDVEQNINPMPPFMVQPEPYDEEEFYEEAE